MGATRHRRDVPRRAVLIGSVLALALGGGTLALGLVPEAALRPVLMGVLLVAVAAGVLAIDEARLAEGRTDAALSRERADRIRSADSWARERAHLSARVDELERELAEVRRAALRPRALVVVAEPRSPSRVSRILEIPDAVPPADPANPADDDAVGVAASIDLTVTEEPGIDMPVIDVPVLDVPVVDATVLGEFSLEGLSMFPRPAGMPESFPAPLDGVPKAAEAGGDPDVIDLRSRRSVGGRPRPA